MPHSLRTFIRTPDEEPVHGLYRDETDALLVYNAETYRGIMHTPEWDARMAELQARWNAAGPPPPPVLDLSATDREAEAVRYAQAVEEWHQAVEAYRA